MNDWLLLFAKRPEFGRVKTRLAAGLGGGDEGAARALSIHRALLADALAAGLEAPFDRRVCFLTGAGELPEVPGRERWEVREQRGDDLGARLADGVGQAFAAGARTVTVMGSDHPRLTAARLRDTWRWSDSGHAAILPTSDGGYAALALPEWIPGLFEKIPWSTSGVLSATREVLNRAAYPHKVLGEIEDIDTAADWLALNALAGACGPAVRAALGADMPGPPAGPPRISIVVPVLDEQRILPLLAARLRDVEGAHEIMIVDGGSTDGTRERLAGEGWRVIDAPRGRARQMNAGALAATGDVLLFLHADTRLPAGWADAVAGAVSRADWGRFDVRVDGPGFKYALLSTLISLRSRLTGVATGDQAIFVTRRAFWRAGGYPDQPLMEDLELCRRLRALGATAEPLGLRAVTSARRWETRGFWRTVLRMWELRFDYFLGADPERLAARYAEP